MVFNRFLINAKEKIFSMQNEFFYQENHLIKNFNIFILSR